MMAERDGATFEAAVGDLESARSLDSISPESYAVAAEFWRVTTEGPHLSRRLRELLLVAMHASSSTLNVDGIRRHVRRALETGASPDEIVDVLITVVALANHALYTSVPILYEELAAAGIPISADTVTDSEIDAARDRYLASRGFWPASRELIMRAMPAYYAALTDVATESWDHGPLSTKDREFVCIAIDCTVRHMYEPGLRSHIRIAIDCGATREEILEIFQLAGLIGLEGYIQGGRELITALAQNTEKSDR